MYDSHLEQDLKHDEYGPVGKVYHAIASGSRADSNVDHDLATSDAKTIYKVTISNFVISSLNKFGLKIVFEIRRMGKRRMTS